MEERLKYLFRQYLNNTCSRKEFDEFFSYIRDAAHNETIRELVKKVYEETGQEHSAHTYVDESGNLVLTRPAWHNEAAPPPIRRRRKRAAIISVCASILLVFLIWLPYKQDQEQPAALAMMTKKITQRSEYKYLLLPDSTQVWLNAASSLEYPPHFDKNKREVFLSGEAYFDVKHADQLPFIIHTGKVSTLVLGTAFNIKAYPGRENIIVSVSRGKVKVQYDNKEVATLTQGQQVKVKNAGSQPVEKKTISTEPAAWQQGNLQYDDETMEDIVAELEQVYDVQIRLQHDAVRHVRIATSFRREIGVDQALQILCQLTDTRLKLDNGLYIIE
jgi:ferric-dicitrate binding protein FerR (iron transport regulator)